MRRILTAFVVLLGFGLIWSSYSQAADAAPYPLASPVTATERVHTGEGPTSFARRPCNVDFTHRYAVQQMNPWYGVERAPGTVLDVPSCPVGYLRPDSPTATTTSSSPTSTPPAVCTAPAGQPGSPDGQGGCFPGPGNVGIPAGTVLHVYTGPCTITTANVVLDGYDFTGCPDGIEIHADNVTISRSRIYNSVLNPEANGYSFTVSDSYLDGAMTAFDGVACVNCGIGGWNFTVLRTEIVHTNRGAYCEFHCLIQDSWIHDTNLDTSPCPQASSGTCPHASGLRVEQYATVIHNTIACDFTGPFNQDLGCSADVSGYADFAPIHDNTLTNNLFRSNTIGAGFCVYGGATAGKTASNDPVNATNVRFTNNVFERAGANVLGEPDCAAYGPVSDFAVGRTGNVWTGNVWSTGGTVQPD